MTGSIGQRPSRLHGGSNPAGELLVQKVGGAALAAGLCQGRSVFTPDRALWTRSIAQELHERVHQPVTGKPRYEDKLSFCLTDAGDDVIQLAAELVSVCLLPVKDRPAVTKRRLVKTILSWMSTPVLLPQDVEEAFSTGVFNGGMGFTVMFWPNFKVLVTIVRHWTELDDAARQALCSDPFGFRDLVMSVPGPNPCAERFALPYLAYPDVFEAIVSKDHRKAIQSAFAAHAGDSTADPDAALLAIRDALEEQAGEPINYYLPPLLHVWQPPAAPPPTPNARAWWVSTADRDEGWVSIDAGSLEAVPDAQADLSAAVRASFGQLQPSEVAERTRLWNAFLTEMQSGALVATTTSERTLLVGRLSESVRVVEGRSGATLRRQVEWVPESEAALSDIPAALEAQITSGHELVDLTAERLLLEAMVTSTGSVDLLLPDATPALARDLLVDHKWLQDCVELLRDRPQLIFYGPPGTGKTWLAQHLAWYLAGKERTTLVQFHPSYSYEDFFEGYRPVLAREGALAFELSPGPFRRAVDRARRDPERPHFVIIDEINRGNLAKIFGELYFLLEYRDENIELLYSRGDATFTMPPNLFLLGTMNTVDRSIALVDTAMRRRFSFVSLHPSVEPTRSTLRRWLAQREFPDTLAGLLEALNTAIEDPDFKVGPSYFMRDTAQQPGRLELLWRTSILPLLEEHYYGTEVDVAKEFALTRMLSLASQGRAGAGVSAGTNEGPDRVEAPNATEEPPQATTVPRDEVADQA